MEQSSSYDEKTVMHQFDRKCKLALKGETVDYERHLAYLRKHETLFSELSEQDMESLSLFDEYELEKSYFRAGGYDVEVKNALLAEALTALTERKRDIILLMKMIKLMGCFRVGMTILRNHLVFGSWKQGLSQT